MDSYELSLWQEKWLASPYGMLGELGIVRWHLALLTAAVINSNPFREKGAPIATADDFLPAKRAIDQPQSVETQKAFAEAIVAALGGGKSEPGEVQ